MQKFQVSFIGLSTLFGRTFALLLKQSPFIKCLKLYDEKNMEAALDVAGLNAACKVKAFLGKEQLNTALVNSDIVVIGEDVSSENPKSDLFSSTAPKILEYAKAIAHAAPEAIIVVAASPLNSLLPLMTEMLVHHGCFDSNKLLGATSMDNIRANSLLANYLKANVRNVILPVIGGSSQETRVPIFSQAKPKTSLPFDAKEKITKNIQKGEEEVKRRKNFPESLSKAYATSTFVNSIMAGLRGEPTMAITLSKTPNVSGVDYFSLPVMLGKSGIVQRFGIPSLTEYEEEMVAKAVQSMCDDVEKSSLYWYNSTTPLLNHRKTTHDKLSSDVINVDTKPQKFFQQNYQEENIFMNKEKIMKIIETLENKINPLDRLLVKGNENHNLEPNKQNINEYDISENKEELQENKQEAIFVLNPKKIDLRREAKEKNEPTLTEEPEKVKIRPKMEFLVEKTEGILSEKNKFVMEKKKPRYKEDKSRKIIITEKEEFKIEPEFRFKMKGFGEKATLAEKMFEKYTTSVKEEKAAKKAMSESEKARREKLLAFKLQRIAEKNILNSQKAKFLKNQSLFEQKIGKKSAKIEESKDFEIEKPFKVYMAEINLDDLAKNVKPTQKVSKMKKTETKLFSNIQEKSEDKIDEKKSNLLQMLPTVQKSYFKPEKARKKDRIEFDENAKQEKTLIETDASKLEKVEKTESKEQIRIIDMKPKEYEVEKKEVELKPKAPTVLEYLSQRPKIENKPKKFPKLNLALQKYFRRQTFTRKSTENNTNFKRNNFFPKLPLEKIAKKSRKVSEKYKNLNVEERKDDLLTLLAPYGVKNGQKPRSQTKKQKNLLHLLKNKRLEKMDSKQTKEIKVPKSLNTGTCADVLRNIKNLNAETKTQTVSFFKEFVPDIKLNEYTCKSNFFPSFKFLKDKV